MTGMRLVSLATMLMVLFRQSKRRVSLFCETALGVQVSPGLVIKWQTLATSATRPAYDDLVKMLPKEKSVNVDETPTQAANASAWIWTVVAQKYTVFTVRLTKTRCVITELLGAAYCGVITIYEERIVKPVRCRKSVRPGGWRFSSPSDSVGASPSPERSCGVPGG